MADIAFGTKGNHVAFQLQMTKKMLQVAAKAFKNQQTSKNQ
jgi:hypothetical protein